MTEASLRWLKARQAFHEELPFEGENDFHLAHGQLLAAFVSDWPVLDNPILLAYAYQCFQRELVRQYEEQRGNGYLSLRKTFVGVLR